jgi:hypothetical protein
VGELAVEIALVEAGAFDHDRREDEGNGKKEKGFR